MNNKPEISLYELETNVYKHELKTIKEKIRNKNTLDKYFEIEIIKKKRYYQYIKTDGRLPFNR